MEIAWAILLILSVLVFWGLTIFGIPGNWLMIAASAWYVFFGPESQPMQMHWGWLIALVILAGLGELMEFAAGALGVAKLGGSKRGASLAMVGSLIGGVAGIFIGLPIPIVGPVVAALGGACLGAFVGAAAGEKWKGKTWDETMKISAAAAAGRFAGTIGKITIGFVMVGGIVSAVVT